MNQAFSSRQLAVVHSGLSLVPVVSVFTTYFHIRKAEIFKKKKNTFSQYCLVYSDNTHRKYWGFICHKPFKDPNFNKFQKEALKWEKRWGWGTVHRGQGCGPVVECLPGLCVILVQESHAMKTMISYQLHLQHTVYFTRPGPCPEHRECQLSARDNCLLDTINWLKGSQC